MAARGRVPLIVAAATALAAVAGASTHPAVRKFLSQYISSSTSATVLKALAVLIAVANLKNLPGVWHYRVFRAIIYQVNFQPIPQPAKHLFTPLVTSSYNSLYDCDYNIHKSNSTYFADLDVARAHHLSCIIRTGLQRLNKGDTAGLNVTKQEMAGRYGIALGAVSCFFQRQIEPLQPFDIYTRVLTWDRKWVYVVSHIVRKGALKPSAYILQPWKSPKHAAAARKYEQSDLTKHIFATGLARYVFKKERLTINPEVVLERSRLLPPRPAGVGLPPRAEGPSSAPGPSTPAALAAPENIAAELDSKLNSVSTDPTPASADEDEDWTWDDMEQERLRGLELAQHFDALNALHNELRCDEVLGHYGDYW